MNGKCSVTCCLIEPISSMFIDAELPISIEPRFIEQLLLFFGTVVPRWAASLNKIDYHSYCHQVMF